MLVITLPFEGLKDPRDRSASKIVDGLVSFKVERLAYKCVGADVSLFVSADVCRSGSESCVSEESEDREEYKEHAAFEDNSLEDRVSVEFQPCVYKFS